MAEEKETATEEVADEDLSKAWDQGVGEKTEEVKEPEEKKEEEKPETETPPEEKPASESEPEEVLDHKESSRLGRKVKGIEGTLQQILARLEQPQTKKEPEVEVPDVITTPEDVEKVLQARESKTYQAKVQYEQNYLKQIDLLKAAKGNEDLHDEIVTEMMQNHNNMYDIRNPSADARVNYAEAKAAVLAKKIANPSPKVAERKNVSEKSPVQPAASATRTAPKTFALPKLDDEAQSYVDYLRKKGMTDEDIAKELA